MKSAPMIASAILLAALGGCQQGTGSEGESTDSATQGAAPDAVVPDSALPDADASAAPDPAADEPKKSIIRADVDVGPTQAPPVETVHLVVPYPAKGARPDEAGRALLDGLLTTPAFAAGGAITIWGHSDSRGSDADNLAASRRRAEAARDYLESKGVAKARISVVALGEARPIAPNRKLDGSDDQEGRARNRRVEVEIAAPQPSAPASPTP
ncbi:OOP family OmpA-OmpF porin [Novosphingobium sp. PhB55]|jgi:OOP family OmpA-OmpF porin|uniref:OmpA family protein n=1 Tax=unclassified Novosphingobium TaxID=2644732 RepID=UPI0010D87996|nr:OmpA family protein [Novosphingobium sp. PhB55]TDW61875.1 OOP family OmpA-OmpF porin [Novosphingobium sp. PhB55]